jgi:DNA-binding SARP family transcriptional activator/tetratricopeptide (TPR) repeat protein
MTWRKEQFGVQIKLLGPLAVHDAGGRSVPVTSAKQRVVLAALALQAGRVVSVDHLVDCLWDRNPPSTARDTVRSHVMRLRKVLPEPEVLVTRAPGYLLAVDPSAVDVNHISACQAHTAAEPRHAAAMLRDALGLWRGSPLADIDSTVLRARHVRALEDVWLRLTESRIDADLADGAHADLVGELRTLVASHPLEERFHGRLMSALESTGQRAEALRAYQDAHRVLVDELGIEPGDELRRIHRRLLGADRRRDTGVPQRPVPALLPLDANGFVGRVRELARLDAALVSAGSQPTATVLVVLSGTAGIGKTTLAVHWAHRVRDRFPDGQLYVDMRGFDHDRPSMSPAEATRIFLEVLGVEPERIPVSPEARTGLYRSLLAGRALLVVLDNASDPEQVRPLLPGSPGCVVLVTSRNTTRGLVAGEAACPVPLSLMSEAEARAVLDRRLGPERTGAERDAVREIIARTAKLPLALAVVAARAATHPGFPLAVLARELRELDAFDVGDPATRLRAVLHSSYQALRPAAARLFRLLGAVTTPDVSTRAAASLAGTPIGETLRAITELSDANLVTEHLPGRYTWHDLLRAYARELVSTVDGEAERAPAVRRFLDHHLHTAWAAAIAMRPQRDPIRLDAPVPGVEPEEIGGSAQALAWFTAERAVLMSVVAQAVRSGADVHTWQLATALSDFLARQSHLDDTTAVQTAALTAAQQLGDVAAQAVVHCAIARCHIAADANDRAADHLRRALDLYREPADRSGQAHTHGTLSWLLERQGMHHTALDHSRRALGLYQALGDRNMQANALNTVGWHHALLGDHHQALRCCRDALALLRELGDRVGEAVTWDSLGYAHRQLGERDEAVACYRRALRLFREAGDLVNEATTLLHLGDTHAAAEEADLARQTWQHAITVVGQHSSHSVVEQIKSRLRCAEEHVVVHAHEICRL